MITNKELPVYNRSMIYTDDRRTSTRKYTHILTNPNYDVKEFL